MSLFLRLYLPSAAAIGATFFAVWFCCAAANIDVAAVYTFQP
jgi:hypothetical protein